MVLTVTSGELQGWIALVGGLAAAVLGILKYFDFRSSRERAAAAGQAFVATVDALASHDEPRRLAGAILLRRFFSPSTEQGEKTIPYAPEAIGVIAALLRGTEVGTLQKILADGLAYAPDLTNADLQGCNLREAYLGSRGNRCPDFSDADFFKADLSGASLKGAKAHSAVFFQATMLGTVFQAADLTEANFRNANLEGAKFNEIKVDDVVTVVDLTRADFSGADLRGARFEGAMLEGARFDGAILDGARFTGAVNLPSDVAQLLDQGGCVPDKSAGPIRADTR